MSESRGEDVPSKTVPVSHSLGLPRPDDVVAFTSPKDMPAHHQAACCLACSEAMHSLTNSFLTR